MNLFCLILGSGFLSDPDYIVHPNAVAVAGAAIAIQAAAEPEALSIVLEGPHAEHLREISFAVAGETALKALSLTACPNDSKRVALVDKADRTPPEGVLLWPIPQSDTGAGPAPEIARALREQLGLSVPRPVAPWQHQVTVLLLPDGIPQEELLRAAFRSVWTSWIKIGDNVVLVTDDPAQLAELEGKHQTTRLTEAVELGQLRLINGALPSDARALTPEAPHVLAICPNGCSDGDAWLDHRFDTTTFSSM